MRDEVAMDVALSPVEGRSKGAELRSRLESLARSLGPGAKLPTVETLCASLQVSRRTLGGALGDLESRGVLRRRQGSGIWVETSLPMRGAERAGLMREVCLVCDAGFFRGEGHSPFWDLLVEAAQARAVADGENLSCHFALDSSDFGGEVSRLHVGLAREIEEGRVQGVIAIGLSPELSRWIEARVPIAAFAGSATHGVTIDGAELLRLGASHLGSLGCRRIGLWSHGPEPREHIEAFARGLGESGAKFDESLVRCGERLLPGADNREMGHALAQQVLEEVLEARGEVFGGGEKLDGVVITNDLMAHGAILALSEAGVEVGRDIHIATHANRGSLVLGHARNLALLEVDPAEIVEALFSRLEDLVAGREPELPWASVRPRLRDLCSEAAL